MIKEMIFTRVWDDWKSSDAGCAFVDPPGRLERQFRYIETHSAPAKDKYVTPRQLISSGSRFEEEIGYSRAVVANGLIFVSGTTGYDYTTMTIVEDVVGQAEQAFLNIAAALAYADSSFDDVVRVLFIVPKREDWQPCWPIIKKYLGQARPASTLIHADLQTSAMRIEIEVTAQRQEA